LNYVACSLLKTFKHRCRFTDSRLKGKIFIEIEKQVKSDQKNVLNSNNTGRLKLRVIRQNALFSILEVILLDVVGHKLVVHWSKRDYIGFSLYSRVLVFCVLAVLRVIQGEPIELPFMAVLSFAMIPVELLIIVIFQKYSSHVDQLLNYPSLLKANFNNDQILENGKVMVFSMPSGVLSAAVLFINWLLLAPFLTKSSGLTSKTKRIPCGLP